MEKFREMVKQLLHQKKSIPIPRPREYVLMWQREIKVMDGITFVNYFMRVTGMVR
jgi:hypothetical protein